jgi:hypothetical protein
VSEFPINGTVFVIENDIIIISSNQNLKMFKYTDSYLIINSSNIDNLESTIFTVNITSPFGNYSQNYTLYVVNFNNTFFMIVQNCAD